MPTEITMPQLGESVHEGTIGKWLKRPGEHVAKYEPLVEVITDKVNVEMPSPLSGVLQEVLVDEGATVVVGTAIAKIEETGRESRAHAAQPPAAPPAASQAPAGSTLAPAASQAPPGSGTVSAAPAGTASPGARAGDGQPATGSRAEAARLRLSPLVRRLVDEHRVSAEELRTISGSGENGRLTKDDVLKYLQSRGPSAPFPSTAVEPPRTTAGAAGGATSGDQLHRLTPLRRAIAERIAQSKREIPHAYGTLEVDMTRLVRHRDAHKAAWQMREGVNISVTAFLVRAATRALRAFPMLNATFTADGILYKQAIHFGVGVAVPDGLVVPVIKHADQKGVVLLAREITQLAARAREGRLTLDDVSGGTFTLTNPGVFGSITSMPVINYPQAAILAADAIVRRPVVVGDGIAIREIMHLGLAFDHRVFDGAVAMQFLTHIKRQLEEFAPSGDSPEM